MSYTRPMVGTHNNATSIGPHHITMYGKGLDSEANIATNRGRSMHYTIRNRDLASAILTLAEYLTRTDGVASGDVVDYKGFWDRMLGKPTANQVIEALTAVVRRAEQTQPGRFKPEPAPAEPEHLTYTRH